MSDTYHHFQCLNSYCKERAVMDLRTASPTPPKIVRCPVCVHAMEYGGNTPADAWGYDEERLHNPDPCSTCDGCPDCER